MRSLNSFLESNWMLNYRSTDQLWLSDSLNWEKTSNLVTSDWTLVNFLFNSSFVNQHLLIDHISKLPHFDAILIQATSQQTSVDSLYLHNAFTHDLVLQTYTCFLPLSTTLQSEYQETFSLALFVAPEISMILSEYVSVFYLAATFSNTPTAVFDSYTNNLNYYPSEGAISMLLFGLYVWFLVYFFTTILSLKWTNPISAHFVRFYYYFFSVSKDIRSQFEAVLQTLVFIILYWGMAILAWDDDQEEVIEFVDNMFFNFFSFVILYLVFRYSIHYFSFLEASETGGRSVSFFYGLSSQFLKDTLNNFSVIIRFYALLFRINVYDNLEDIFDSYYIFVGDFDDDEYFSELFLSLHGTLLFTLDNHDDRSFLLEDENDFANDFFYTYYLVWAKLFYFWFFLAEILARLGLGFYITYLITFEVHAVNCSYLEDTYVSSKKQNR